MAGGREMTTAQQAPVEQEAATSHSKSPVLVSPSVSLSESNLQMYRVVLLISILLAGLSFSYNVWRLEVSERNNPIRAAGMQVLLELSELEQLIFIAHYDNDLIAGNPRKAWVRVGLIQDLSILVSDDTVHVAETLRQVWQKQWPYIAEDVDAVNQVGTKIDKLRDQIKYELKTLR